MQPPFSVIFLTTLIGAGQGLFLALFAAQCYTLLEGVPQQSSEFYAYGSIVALVFLIAGLIASFFHLGHPERAWRSATQWRTSWLSREVIALPLFMLMVFIYGAAHYFGAESVTSTPNAMAQYSYQSNGTLIIGAVGVLTCFALFICTGMIYACLKFLQEWHTPLTPINYTLFGLASGFTLAAVYTYLQQSQLLQFMTLGAILSTAAALITRGASLIRNYRLKYKSNLTTAIGVRHNKIQQKAQGAMGGSFNTREFFHNKTASFLKSIKWIFLGLVFPVPIVLLSLGMANPQGVALFALAFVLQYIGLIAERWFFFAQAKHPQNLYYQTI